MFNGSSGKFGYYLIETVPTTSAYLFCFNPDSFGKQVSYTIYHTWTYNNYLGLAVGLAHIVFGASAFVIMMFKKKLYNFNKALETELSESTQACGSPWEIRTLVRGSRGPYAWPLHQRAASVNNESKFNVINFNVALPNRHFSFWLRVRTSILGLPGSSFRSARACQL